MEKPFWIACAGNALVGKDLFFNLLQKELFFIKKTSLREAFADILKEELKSFIFEKTGRNINNRDPEFKKIIRPILVEWGLFRRKLSNNRYFIDKVNEKINVYNRTQFPDFVIITDLRYCETENDELSFIKKEKKGIVVYIDKYYNHSDGKQFVIPANEHELRNNPILKKNADYLIEWKHCYGDKGEIDKELVPKIKSFTNWLLEKYE